MFFKGTGHGVGRGGGQVLPGAQRLPVTGVQQVVEGLVLLDGGGSEARCLVESVIAGQRFPARVQQQAADFLLALAAVLGQDRENAFAHQLALLQPPGLPLGRRGQGVQVPHLGDAPPQVLEDVVLHLLPQLDQGIGQSVQVVRGEHQASPKCSVSAAGIICRAFSSSTPKYQAVTSSGRR